MATNYHGYQNPEEQNTNISSYNRNQLLPCAFNDGNHQLFHCSTIKTKATYERLQTVYQLDLCWKCLGINHRANNSPSSSICRANEYWQVHNALLNSSKSRYGRTVTSYPQPIAQLKTRQQLQKQQIFSRWWQLFYITRRLMFKLKRSWIQEAVWWNNSQNFLQITLLERDTSTTCLGRSQRKKTKACYTTSTKNSSLEDNERYNGNQVYAVSFDRKYDHLTHVNLPTLDNLQVTELIAQGNNNLDFLQCWTTAKRNIECIILLCIAVIAANKALTSTK